MPESAPFEMILRQHSQRNFSMSLFYHGQNMAVWENLRKRPAPFEHVAFKAYDASYYFPQWGFKMTWEQVASCPIVWQSPQMLYGESGRERRPNYVNLLAPPPPSFEELQTERDRLRIALEMVNTLLEEHVPAWYLRRHYNVIQWALNPHVQR